MKKSILALFMIAALLLGCESEKNNEMEKRKNQVPQTTQQDQTPLQKIEVMTEFTPEQAKIKDLVLEAVHKNLEATHLEDVELVLETIHEDSPQLASTRSGMEYVFKNYDMVYELEEAHFLSISSEDVQLLYQQTTKSVQGSGFQDMRSIGIHTIKKSADGNWKIFKTDYISSDPIK
jgi:PBP1b-binding outer membrane lipoprotein LpoB